HNDATGRKPEVAGFQARKPPPLVKRRSVPQSASKGWDFYRPANWVNGTPVFGVAARHGHSLRAGYATSAAARNMPAYRIQSHTRHKSAEVVAGYILEADKWTKSGLDGVGF